jgi:PAS domain-containing protein
VGASGPDIDSSPTVYCLLHDGVVTYVGAVSGTISGYSFEHYRGRRAVDLVHPEDRPVIAPYLTPGWEGTFALKTRLRDADGAWTWRRVEGVRTIDSTGLPSAAIMLRRADAPALGDRPAETERAVASAEQPIDGDGHRVTAPGEPNADLSVVFVILSDGMVRFVSSAVEGESFEHLLGRHAYDVVHPDDHATIAPFFARGWEGAVDVVIRVRDHLGGWTPRRVEGVRTIGSDGHPGTVCALSRVDSSS